MWVKICANTNLEDALTAAEHGADAVGFVFAPSKRQVTPAQVAAITPHLPARLEKVGVFTSGDESEIRAAASEAGLTTVQLHGPLDLTLLRGLATPAPDGRTLRVIQTLHWPVQEDAMRPAPDLIREQLARIADLNAEAGTQIRVLVDSKIGDTSGGTGISFDWSAAAQVFASARSAGVPVIVAGGLRPENVAEAIARLAPGASTSPAA